MRGTVALLVAVLALSGLLLPGCITRSENRPPTAVFSATSTAVNVGQKIILDASNSTDKDGKIVRFHWDFGDSTEDMGVSVEHFFSDGGIYVVTLTVTDNEGKKDRTNASVRVNEYPKAVLDCASTDAKVFSQVTFSGGNSTDPDGTVTGYRWDFGDGTGGSGARVAHAYADLGTYTVNLTVTDDFGAQANRSIVVTVVLRTFDVSWALLSHSLPQMSGYSDENTTQNKTAELSFDNMTMARFQLTWVDDIRHWLLGRYNDDFSLRMYDPDNNTQWYQNEDGNITLNFSLAEPPAPQTFNARTADEILAQLGDKYLTSVGRGTWRAEIVLGEAGGAQDLAGTDADRGNSWKLDMEYFQYEPVITER